MKEFFKKPDIMFTKTLKIFFFMMAIVPIAWSPLSAQEEEGGNETKTISLQNRIDFGNAYIMGQSIKSGSVYLLHRKKSDINSMLKIRTDFRDEIIEDFSLEDTQIISQEVEADKKS